MAGAGVGVPGDEERVGGCLGETGGVGGTGAGLL